MGRQNSVKSLRPGGRGVPTAAGGKLELFGGDQALRPRLTRLRHVRREKNHPRACELAGEADVGQSGAKCTSHRTPAAQKIVTPERSTSTGRSWFTKRCDGRPERGEAPVEGRPQRLQAPRLSSRRRSPSPPRRVDERAKDSSISICPSQAAGLRFRELIEDGPRVARGLRRPTTPHGLEAFPQPHAGQSSTKR